MRSYFYLSGPGSLDANHSSRAVQGLGKLRLGGKKSQAGIAKAQGGVLLASLSTASHEGTYYGCQH